MSLLCVGAVSRRVVEEAARLHVHQIVASRRQVDVGGGYIGWDQDQLVTVVRRESSGQTDVIRDHGGPLQGGKDDDGFKSLDRDVDAGFDGLHLDVCEVPRGEQVETLGHLLERYGSKIPVEVGGEHESPHWNNQLLEVALDLHHVTPSYYVVGGGTFVWADRQLGSFNLRSGATAFASLRGVKTKMHNMDWIGKRKDRLSGIDAYNLAPELGQVEVRALLAVLHGDDAQALLRYAYDTGSWTRWFKDDEGTWLERAECAVRYHLEDPELQGILSLYDYQEKFVRGCISAAILCG